MDNFFSNLGKKKKKNLSVNLKADTLKRQRFPRHCSVFPLPVFIISVYLFPRLLFPAPPCFTFIEESQHSSSPLLAPHWSQSKEAVNRMLGLRDGPADGRTLVSARRQWTSAPKCCLAVITNFRQWHLRTSEMAIVCFSAPLFYFQAAIIIIISVTLIRQTAAH